MIRYWYRFAHRIELLLAICVVVLGVMLYMMVSASAATRQPAAAANEYTGPFVMMRVPALCAFPQKDLRYYFDQAPAGSSFLRSGAHGHGGNLRCIYFATDNTTYPAGDHPYGKWLVFNENGVGLFIGPTGIDVSYVNCALPGYHFPYPPGNGQPNDCGESWLPGTDESAQYRYQDNTAGDMGHVMYPPTLP